jgi:hypothetical protein
MRNSVRFVTAIVSAGFAALTTLAIPSVAGALPAQPAALASTQAAPSASVRWDSEHFGFVFTFTPTDLQAVAAGGAAGASSVTGKACRSNVACLAVVGNVAAAVGKYASEYVPENCDLEIFVRPGPPNASAMVITPRCP